ncbi:MAG: periplasmic heavy metal sensor [Hyphomicrobium sp.]|uniref:periplasmic heavy metal sensor n=1 Tax=Hyphomicrobium sp. TaxID=82 RepID=UPI003D0C5858
MTEASQPGTVPPAAGSRRLKYALIASLALNLLIIGAVAGTMYGYGKHRRGPGGGVRGEDFGLMGLTFRLPDERKKEIRKRLRADREALRPLVEEVRTARRQAAEKLAAETFDKAALEGALDAAGEKDRTLRAAAIAAFLAQAEQLTAEERRMLAEWWMKRNEPPKARKRKKDTKDAKADAN